MRFRRLALPAALVMPLLAMLGGCTPVSGVQQVQRLVDEHAVYFSPSELPAPLLEKLAQHKLVIIGESHYSREHQELLTQLASSLQRTGCRQVLLEANHAFGWMMDDYVLGNRSTLPNSVRLVDDRILEDIRHFNAKLPPEARVHVQAIDMNHWPESVDQSLAAVEEAIGQQDVFRAVYGLKPGTRERLQAVQEAHRRLLREKDAYARQWRKQWFDRVCEVLEIEEESSPLRGPSVLNWESRRETIITRLVERRVSECGGQTLLNVGSNHAQRRSVLNTWSTVAQRLTRNATPGRPAPYIVSIIPMSGEAKDNYYSTRSTRFNLCRTAAPNDLVGILGRSAGPHWAFLPLEDPAFIRERFEVTFNRRDTRQTSPKEQFDAFVVYPEMSLIESLDKYRSD